MKSISLIACILTLSATMLMGQTGPVLQFDQKSIELGTLFSDEVGQTNLDISFTNTGDQPLVLSSARGCCGTRIVSWPREPIAPGEKGIISIEFRLQPRVQSVSRTVTVVSNDPEPQKIIRIRGQVVERKNDEQTE